MHRQRAKPAVISIAPTSGRWAALANLKPGILLLLGAWIAYFVVVEVFIRALAGITVPVLEIPLSVLIVGQGCAVLFLGALYLLTRGQPG